MANSDTFSLEDDDFNGLFITQSGSNHVEMQVDGGDDQDDVFFGLKNDDFVSQMEYGDEACGIEESKYSDISEDDFEKDVVKPTQERSVLL